MFIISIVQKEKKYKHGIWGYVAYAISKGIFSIFLKQNSKLILKDADYRKLIQEISQQKNLKHKGQ